MKNVKRKKEFLAADPIAQRALPQVGEGHLSKLKYISWRYANRALCLKTQNYMTLLKINPMEF